MSRPFRRGSRVFFLILVSIVIIGVTYVDKEHHASARQLTARLSSGDENRHSRVWYCVGGTAHSGSIGDTSIHIANTTSAERTVAVTAYNDEGKSAVHDLVAPPFSSQGILLSDTLVGNFESAVVSADHEGIVADMVVKGPQGLDVDACQSRLRSDFYLADGSTRREGGDGSVNKTYLSLFNPSADRVAVNVTLTALADENEPGDVNAAIAEDPRAPIEWTNKQLSPRSLTVLDIGSLVAHRAGMIIHVASKPGRVVAGELIVRQGTLRSGLSLLTGSLPTSKSYFAYGIAGDSASERLMVGYPTNDSNATDTKVLMQPRYPVSGDVTSIDPIERTIAANQFDFFSVGTDGRVPKNVSHAWDIESGQPVVVARAIDISGAKEVGESSGISDPARQWVIPYGGTDLSSVTLEIANFSTSSDASVEISSVMNGVSTVSSVPVVKAGQRLSVRLNDFVVPGAFVMVKSTKPVVIERTYSTRFGAGFSVGPAIPIG